jgi:crotonobetainyl-CoA:carnitine CoA-transferase CaiB-like acyl-CoA transferase
MLDAGLSFFWPDGMLRHTLIGGGIDHYVVPGERYQLSSCANGHLIIWAGTAEQMRGSLRAVGREDLADSPTQRGKPMLLEENQLERTQAVRDGLEKLTTTEAYRRMIEFEVPAAPVLSHSEVLEDPQIQRNGTVSEATHPVYGRYRRVKQAVRFSKTVPAETPAAALYAEHTEEILDEFGIDEPTRRRLRNAEVIA